MKKNTIIVLLIMNLGALVGIGLTIESSNIATRKILLDIRGDMLKQRIQNQGPRTLGETKFYQEFFGKNCNQNP